MNDLVTLINRPLDHKGGKYPLVSLFSGIMGLDIGLERAGFKTKYALDFDKDSKAVIENNRDKVGDFPYVCDDINKITPESILKTIGLKPGEVAIMAGGPPCQPFSKSGLRKGSSDPRGQLFKRYLDYLTVIQPQSFVLENVRGLYSSKGGEDFKNILEHFNETGYTVYWKILDAANYGIPQFRQRLFIVGFKDRIMFNFPTETHGDPKEISGMLVTDLQPFRTVEDALSGVAETAKGPKLNGKYAHLLHDIPEGMNYSYYTKERGHKNPVFEWRSKFWYFLLKTDRSKPSLTIQAYPGNNTGPFHWENRRMAIEEIRRIQTLPDWLEFGKSYMKSHKLIGNAVPSLLGEKIGIQVMKALKEHKAISLDQYEQIKNLNTKNGHIVKSGRGSRKFTNQS